MAAVGVACEGWWMECSSEEELSVDAANNESNGTERIGKVKEAHNSGSQRVKCKSKKGCRMAGFKYDFISMSPQKLQISSLEVTILSTSFVGVISLRAVHPFKGSG